ncbi:MAG: zinc-binding dehydrogenase [Clostridia bacterium]|nr:zinc-binding dehydrogenase [Clostridia bacterium]MBO5755551.1 zinc-binding dehydrogenase [Clostridia bacterium]MBO7169818.1 zinc-binding dehydrogenase [Clostridia bacterium]
MKAITVYGPHDARMEEVPTPAATGDMLLIKVKRTGVCATDLSIYTGESSFIRSGEIVFPCRFGHEYAGVVEAVGPEVTKFKPGDRVYTENFVACGKCEACKRGDYMACGHIDSVGTVNCWDGCYAEYMQMPERHVYHLPDELSMDEGALIEPASIAYDAFKGVTLTEKDTVVVYGPGAIGMISAWLAKYYGAGQVIMVGRSDEKVRRALEVGADKAINNKTTDVKAAVLEMTGGKGASLVVETTGSAAALKESMTLLAKYGRLSIVSFYERELDGIMLDPLVLGCNSIVGAAGCYGNAPAVCEIMRKNPIKLTPIITHHIPFENCLDVFENEESYHKTKIKIMIDFE